MVVTPAAQSEGVDEDNLSASSNSDFIHAVVPVAVAERLVDAPYFEFEHRDTGDVVHRVGTRYTLPRDVSPHVDFVGPTVRFPATSRVRVETPARASPLLRGLESQQQYGGVTPSSLRKLYNVGDVQASSPNNIQAVAQYLKQYYSPSDLKSFFSKYYTPAEGRTVRQVIGPNKPSRPGVEASLDIEVRARTLPGGLLPPSHRLPPFCAAQYIMAMGANVSTLFWSTPGNAPDNPQNEVCPVPRPFPTHPTPFQYAASDTASNPPPHPLHRSPQPFLAFLTALSNDTKPPLVVSTSYGDNEVRLHRPPALAASGSAGVTQAPPVSRPTGLRLLPVRLPHQRRVPEGGCPRYFAPLLLRRRRRVRRAVPAVH